MRKPLFSILVLLAIALPVSGQYTLGSIPQSLLENAHYIIREERKLLEIKSEAEGVLEYKQVITVLGKSNPPPIYLPYDSDSPVLELNAVLYDPMGRLIKTFKKSDFKDISAVSNFSLYEDNRIKYLDYGRPASAFTIEWSYKQKIKGILMAVLPDWVIQEYHTAVEKSQFAISLPSNLQLAFRSKNIHLEPRTSQLGSKTTHLWTVGNLPAIKEEVYAPHPLDVLPQVQLSLSKFQIGPYSGSMDSWQSFGAFMKRLYDDRNELPDDAKAEALALTKGLESRQEKIKALYRFLQANTRYVSVQLGIGGWQPFSGKYVSQNKYGDCKALTNFMKLLLEAADIRSYPAIISNSELPRTIDPHFAHDPGFNHVVLYIPDEDWWLECTSSSFSPNYLGSDNAARTALLLTEQGGQLIRTPELGIQDNIQHWEYHVWLSETEPAHLRVKGSLAGEPHERYRLVQKMLAGLELEKWFLQTTQASFSQIDSLRIVPNPDSPEAQLSFSASINHLGSRSGVRWFIPALPFKNWNESIEKMERRQHPVHIPKNRTLIEHWTFQLPAGYHPESFPQLTPLETPFGRHHLQVEYSNEQVSVRRTLELFAYQGPAENYGLLYEFLREAAKRDQTKFVLLKK